MKIISVKSLTTCLILFIAFVLPGKAQVTKNFAVSNFSEVSVAAGIEMIIIQGTTESAKVVASAEIIDEVKIEKSGNSLSVSWKEDRGRLIAWKNKSAKVYINFKDLHVVKASSGSSLRTENLLKTDRLNASVSSGASLTVKLNCNDLQLETSSGSSAAFSGSVTNMEMDASSGSTVDALALAATYARVNSSSGADIKINVSKALETTTSSGSHISFKGEAALKNNSSSRSSGVSRIN